METAKPYAQANGISGQYNLICGRCAKGLLYIYIIRYARLKHVSLVEVADEVEWLVEDAHLLLHLHFNLLLHLTVEI